MSKRDKQRKQADRDFEEVRQAIANLSGSELCESLREVPHRKWIEVEKDTHMAIGIMSHCAANRIERLEQALTELHAMVRGECPSLLNEDSGGNGELDVRICGMLGL